MVTRFGLKIDEDEARSKFMIATAPVWIWSSIIYLYRGRHLSVKEPNTKHHLWRSFNPAFWLKEAISFKTQFRVSISILRLSRYILLWVGWILPFACWIFSWSFVLAAAVCSYRMEIPFVSRYNICWRTIGRGSLVLINNPCSVQLILPLPMISYGLNRIFRDAQFGTVNWNSGNNDPDPLFFEEANTGTIKWHRNKGS